MSRYTHFYTNFENIFFLINFSLFLHFIHTQTPYECITDRTNNTELAEKKTTKNIIEKKKKKRKDSQPNL